MFERRYLHNKKKMANTDEVVLSFNDSLLRVSDVRSLENPTWLNDRIIAFCFEYFEKEQFNHSADRLCFISPEVTQFIKAAPGKELGPCLENLNLPIKQYVFLAVNDCDSLEQPGGTHWSLLVYIRPRQEFQHFDSKGGYNRDTANAVSMKLQPHVRAPAGRLKFVEKDAPQQENGYDCGMYVITMAEHIAKELVEGFPVKLTDVVTPTHVSNKRQQIQQLINQLACKSDDDMS